MAGRGVDIKLGEGVRELGGLYVLGTERHESRRIDNQLRGRSGRQGDPGETRFYLSGQDDLVRLFAGDRIYNIMERFKLPDDQPMEAKILSNQIEGAQKKVEEQNFVSRKNVLKYDDVMNVQRQVIYEQRRAGARRRGHVGGRPRLDRRGGRAHRRRVHRRASSREEWDLDALCAAMQSLYGTEITADELREEVELDRARRSIEEFQADARDAYDEKEEEFGNNPDTGEPLLRDVERYVMLQIVDLRWREHLENMEYLREGIHLRAMAQKDPLVEYRARGPHHVRGARRARSARRSSARSSTRSSRRAPQVAAAARRRRRRGRRRTCRYEHESLAGVAGDRGGGSRGREPARPRRRR